MMKAALDDLWASLMINSLFLEIHHLAAYRHVSKVYNLAIVVSNATKQESGTYPGNGS